MVYMVKESLDIDVHYIVQMLLLHLEVGRCDGMLTSSVGSEAEASFMELCLADRFQNLKDALLNETVRDGGDSKGPCFAVSLGDFHSADTLGLIPAKFILDVSDEFSCIPFIQVPDGPVVCSRCSASGVFADVPIGQHDVAGGTHEWDQIGEGTAPAAFVVQLVQCALHLVVFCVSQFLLCQCFVWFTQSQRDFLSEIPLFLVLREPLNLSFT